MVVVVYRVAFLYTRPRLDFSFFITPLLADSVPTSVGISTFINAAGIYVFYRQCKTIGHNIPIALWKHKIHPVMRQDNTSPTLESYWQ